MLRSLCTIFLCLAIEVMSVSIPKSTGPYPVACHDILNKPGLDSCMFRIYYPTRKSETNDEVGPEWMDPEYLQQLSKFMGTLETFRIPVLKDGPILLPTNVSKLPVVLLSHGLMLSKDAYSFICSDIASYGFIVAALDHRDESASASFYMEKNETAESGYVKKYLPFNTIAMGTDAATALRKKQVDKRVEDISRLINCLEDLNDGKLENLLSSTTDLAQFKGKLDLEKVAITGHSHGGATCIALLAIDNRVKVAVPLDSWMLVLEDKYYKIKNEKPMLFINCLGEVKKFDILKMRLLDGDVTGTSAVRKMVTILGSTHLTQTDFAFFPNSWLKKINFVASNDALAMNKLNTKLILSFIRSHLGLPGAGEIDDIIKDNSDYLISGSDIKVEDKEIEAEKAALKN